MFCGMSLNGHLSEALSIISLSLCVLDKKTTEAKCISYHIIYITKMLFIIVAVTLDHLANVAFFSFGIVRLVFCSPCAH